MFHDTVMSLVVVIVIVALACIWKWTADENGGSGWLGVLLTDKADPGTVNFVPRPRLVLLLPLLSAADLQVARVGAARHRRHPDNLPDPVDRAAFSSTCGQERRILRRPVALVAAGLVVLSMGVLTYKGATAKEALASEVIQAVPTWAQKQGFANNAKAVAGAKLFAQSGCTSCHTYLGTGSSNLGAPDLSSIGSSGQGAQFFSDYVSNPRSSTPRSCRCSELGSDENIRNIGIFLDASRGG
jgi:cytochrome c553